MDFLTLSEWLAWLEAERPIRQINYGIDNVLPIAKSLGLTDFDCHVISVAGTNGKGSCVAMLEQVAIEADLTVASYTSPHLWKFTERIRYQGHPITELACCRAFHELSQKIPQNYPLSYFEWTTLAALLFFKQLRLDILILEIGLGGRLDAVNVVNQDTSIITNIALDHQEYLGDTREKIAYEKAGIIKRDLKVIYADPDPVNVIAEVASQNNAELYCYDQDYSYQLHQDTMSWQGPDIKLELPAPALPHPSVAAAIMACAVIDEFQFTEKQITRACIEATLPGRLQLIRGHVNWILDVGHNPAAAAWIRQRLDEQQYSRVHFVFGVQVDKNWQEIVQTFFDMNGIWYTCNIPGNRSLSACASEKYLINHDQLAMGFETVADACQQASLFAKKGECIVIFGSFLTVAEGLPVVNEQYLRANFRPIPNVAES